MENDKFKEAELLMNSSNYKNTIGIDNELKHRFHLYYNKGNYEKAQEILKDSLISKEFPFRIINYAHLGRLKKIDSLLKTKKRVATRFFVLLICIMEINERLNSC